MSEKSKYLGGIIKSLRESRGISAKEMPRLLSAHGFNIKYPTYMGYESGNSTPNADLFLALCDIFQVDNILSTFGFGDGPAPASVVSREIDGIFDMLNDAGQAELCRYGRYLGAQEEYKAAGPVIRKAPARIIPLLGMSFAAGAPESPGDLMFSDYETTDPRAEFAIRVNGNSMEPALPDGSIALGVKRLPRDGEVGAFFLDGGFLVKQFCSDGKNTYLLSLNRARSDADETIWASGGRDLRCVGTILLDRRYPLPD